MGGIAGQIVSALLGQVMPQARSIQRSAVGGAVIAVFVITAYCALVFALWFALAASYGPIISSLVIAFGSLVLGLLAWGITHIVNDRAERRQRELAQLRVALSPEAQLVETALGALPELVRNKPFVTLACVAIAAFVATRSASSK